LTSDTPAANLSDHVLSDNSSENTATQTNSTSTATQGLTTSETVPSANSSNASDLSIQFVSPQLDQVFDRTSATVILETRIDAQVELRVNNRVVDSNQVGQVEANSTTRVMRQIWYGVVLTPGENVLTATATLDGKTATTTIVVQVPDSFQGLRLTTIEKRVPADGRSIVQVQGFLIDKNGNVSNQGTRVTLEASAGTFLGTDVAPEAPGFQVDANGGTFTAQLQAPLQSGQVQIRAQALGKEAFTQVQFETALRPSLVTGVIDLRVGGGGTNFFDGFEDFLPLDGNNDLKVDLDGAFFATGTVGGWLLTTAYNYDYPLNETCNNCTRRLFRADQPSEKPYPVYGDNSSVTNVTPSQDHFYLRLERTPNIVGADPNYAMWGDFSTQREFANLSQDFTAFSRQLHGAGLNYNFGNLQVSGLYSQGGEVFQRDTIVPDGTRGFYFLRNRLVVPGSEEVYAEFEELERPGTVLTRERLQRVTDYEIDYDRGSLFFEEPLLRTDVGDDGEILVQRIVVSYQYETSGDDNRIVAGRLRYHFDRDPQHQSWLGTTYLQEDKGQRNFELYGADAFISLGGDRQFLAEYAHSSNDSDVLGSVSGDAYRAEFTGTVFDYLRTRAYYRHTDTGFANDSTVSFVPGQTRYGAEVQAEVSPRTRIRVQYDHEDNKGTVPLSILTVGDLLAASTEPRPGDPIDNSLTTISAGVQQQFGRGINLNVDWIYRDREDRLNSNANVSSSQLRTQLRVPLTSYLSAHLLNQTTLSASTDSIYSDRTQAGLDWKIAPGISLALNQNWYTRGALEGQTTTSVTLGGDYRIAKNTVLTGRYGAEMLSGGIVDTLGVGIRQGWTIRPGLKVDLAYERIFGNLLGGGDFGVGQGASRSTNPQSGDSISLGVNYNDNPNWRAGFRFEYRNVGGNSRSNFSGDLSGKLTPALTALVNFDRNYASGRQFNGLGASTTLRAGLAYRNPYSDIFNALLRYEYRENPSTIPETLLVGSGTGSRDHLVALEAIYAPNWQWEFYTKLGLRHSTSFLAEDFTASSFLTLAQFRATYQLNRRFDLTGEVRMINQPSADFTELGFLAEVGYHLTPDLRLAVGYSGGSVNSDRDFSGSRASSGIYGGVTFKLNRLFQGFGVQRPLSAAQSQQRLIQANRDTDKPNLQAALPQPLRLDVSRQLEFESNSATLDSPSTVILNSLATVMQQYPDLKIDIQGHLGSLAALQEDDLQVKRLQAARQYLLLQGIPGDRIIIRSLGAPPVANAPEQDNNRLISFVLSGSAQTFQLLSSRLQNTPAEGLLQEALPNLQALNPSPQIEATTPSEATTLTEALENLPAKPEQTSAFTSASNPEIDATSPTETSAALESESPEVGLEDNPENSVETSLAPESGPDPETTAIGTTDSETAELETTISAVEFGELGTIGNWTTLGLLDGPRPIGDNPDIAPRNTSPVLLPQFLQDSLSSSAFLQPASNLSVSVISMRQQPESEQVLASGFNLSPFLQLALQPNAPSLDLALAPNLGLALAELPKTAPPRPELSQALSFSPNLAVSSVSVAQLPVAETATLPPTLLTSMVDLQQAIELALQPDGSDLGLQLALVPSSPDRRVASSTPAKPTETAENVNRNAATPLVSELHLTSAIQFLFSQDIDAFETVLRAAGATQPEIRGEVINLDQLDTTHQDSDSGETNL
jgi:outer membrane protein OmpA-like peptidoglycan-associated protein